MDLLFFFGFVTIQGQQKVYFLAHYVRLLRARSYIPYEVLNQFFAFAIYKILEIVGLRNNSRANLIKFSLFFSCRVFLNP